MQIVRVLGVGKSSVASALVKRDAAGKPPHQRGWKWLPTHVRRPGALVDTTYDAAETANPAVMRSITLSPGNSLLLPVNPRELRRSVKGVDGAYRGHVYRDCMVLDQPVLDHLVIVAPVVGCTVEEARTSTHFEDLRAGLYGTTPPEPDNQRI